jgi:alginate O-acetyltransferase complex protein AlgI
MLTSIRNWAVLALSVLGVFWLQPATAIRYLDFWLPATSLALCALVWCATLPAAGPLQRRALLTDAGVLVGVIALVAALRYAPNLSTLVTRSRPPEITAVLVFVLVVSGLCLLALRLRLRGARALWTGGLLLFILLLIALKTEPLSTAVSAGLRALQGQGTAQASALDWRWLGFSYVSFRLMSALRERANNRLPAMRLREFVSYAIFAPALQAGPIDRPDRFLKDLRAPYAPSLEIVIDVGKRLFLGAFKKFALADTLALIALSDANAMQLRPGWAWLPLYAYALRIYFDFGGYTDIALGLGRLLGIKLPENFNAPYLKPNLTLFWNSWHMSLAQWFRAYWFNPLTRALRIREWAMTPIILLGQSSTMLLIALWHGVTLNFIAWGLWHAAGLFVHNRWADFAKTRLAFVSDRPGLQRVVNITGAVLTFHFVALGWVWFALSTPAAAWAVLGALFGR